ncbi:hypothetical protein R1flu_021394 [Riccia fluitans]|uniref:Uncharacterized protein n=1 Tax=Riccia fluitans TaxID=41844 RepID=A0ABD1ZP99_9MARC
MVAQGEIGSDLMFDVKSGSAPVHLIPGAVEGVRSGCGSTQVSQPGPRSMLSTGFRREELNTSPGQSLGVLYCPMVVCGTSLAFELAGRNWVVP